MENKKKLAIIGASYLQLPLIEKAKRMGYETHVFAWKCGDKGEDQSDYFYPISIIEKEAILDKCKELKIDGICSIASDLAMLTVNYIACQMGLIGNGQECTLKSTNKRKMREEFQKEKDPIPMFFCCSDFAEINIKDLKYPVIVKPSDRSGSRGITKVDNERNLLQAFEKAKMESFEKKVLIESYIEGEEYSIEFISYAGKHTYLAATKKSTTGAPSFIETGHKEPSGLKDIQLLKIQNIIIHALTTLGIQYGASHSEIKITPEGKIFIIEIGARMGGDCIGSHLVYYSTGLDFLEMVIQVALGIKPTIKKKHNGFPVEIKYIFNQKDYEILINLKRTEEEKLLYISDIDMSGIESITDSSNRLGCYIRKI